MTAEQDRAKQAVGERAAGLVETGMRLGLGTGSTAERFLRALGGRVQSEGLAVTGVATSERTSRLAQELGIPLVTLDEAGALDLAVDGADEADQALRLIKGGGGALLREKLVASAARRTVILVDPSKQVQALGRFPLPVEIVGFGARITLERIGALIGEHGEPGGVARLRLDNYGEPFVTDGGNLIIDAAFGAIRDPEALCQALDRLTGVVEHGLFIGLCDELIVGAPDGHVMSVKAGA
jgi:ribose 5-phosphate isomerase A